MGPLAAVHRKWEERRLRCPVPVQGNRRRPRRRPRGLQQEVLLPMTAVADRIVVGIVVRIAAAGPCALQLLVELPTVMPPPRMLARDRPAVHSSLLLPNTAPRTAAVALDTEMYLCVVAAAHIQRHTENNCWQRARSEKLKNRLLTRYVACCTTPAARTPHRNPANSYRHTT